MSDGFVRGKNLICGLHYWDYRLDSGASECNEKNLPISLLWVEDDQVSVDPTGIETWAQTNPQPLNPKAYLGIYADTAHGIDEEPNNGSIQRYAKGGSRHTGEHGAVDAMGVSRVDFPLCDGIQIVTALLQKAPLLEEESVGILVSNFAMQAIGYIAMQARHANDRLIGIATQKPSLVSWLVVGKLPQRLTNFFNASTELMQVMARACGYDHLSKFNPDDLTTWKTDMSELSGIVYGGIR